MRYRWVECTCQHLPEYISISNMALVKTQTQGSSAHRQNLLLVIRLFVLFYLWARMQVFVANLETALSRDLSVRTDWLFQPLNSRTGSRRAQSDRHKRTSCTVLVSCSLLYPQQHDPPANMGVSVRAMPWQVEVQGKETKSLASRLRFPSFRRPLPARLHPQHSPVTMCVITGAPRDTHTLTHTHTAGGS